MSFRLDPQKNHVQNLFQNTVSRGLLDTWGLMETGSLLSPCRADDWPCTSVATYTIGPRCTPTVDGKHVYTLGAEGHLRCLRVTDRTVVWKRDLVSEYGMDVPEWGIAAHPLVDGDRLICMVGGSGTTCVAFHKQTGDKQSGKEIWRAFTARQPGYCPPVIYELGGMRQLVTWDSDAVSGLNPINGMRAQKPSTLRCFAHPFCNVQLIL